ncbi:MAG: hypothetical protein RR782_07615 [Clostridium sp.]
MGYKLNNIPPHKVTQIVEEYFKGERGLKEILADALEEECE